MSTEASEKLETLSVKEESSQEAPILGPDGQPLSKKALKKLEKEKEKQRRRLKEKNN